MRHIALDPLCRDITPQLTCLSFERLFRALFGANERTLLIGGGVEPFYRACGDSGGPNLIIYSADFLQSALHEVAHWCIAGRARRSLDDYGYWYVPDGRDIHQQRLFEAVEAPPQALEWILSRAAGQRFRVSVDNLSGEADAATDFRQEVSRRAQRYLTTGLPPRAARLADALDPSAAYARLHHYLQPAPY